MCDCFRIGGPFIAEDPDCPIHGRQSIGRSETIETILEQVRDGELSPSVAVSMIEELYY